MNKTFQIVVMGCTGGPREHNLSGYLLSPMRKQQWIALDAGSLLRGIDLAVLNNSFPPSLFSDPDLSSSGEMFLKHLKAFLISHAHLDHIAGLVLNSPIDTSKPILGINPTIDNLRDHIFNGRIWPNYGNEGVEPILRKYNYVRLPLHKPQPITPTSMNVEAYLLSHPRGYPSTAFLIEYEGEYLLYFGDTSSDTLEVEKHLGRVWQRITPLIKQKKLKALFLECSYSHNDADQTIFGHLDTRLMMTELHKLAGLVQNSLEGLNVVVTHRKESIKKEEDPKEAIVRELTKINDLGVHFIFPKQGGRIEL